MSIMDVLHSLSYLYGLLTQSHVFYAVHKSESTASNQKRQKYQPEVIGTEKWSVVNAFSFIGIVLLIGYKYYLLSTSFEQHDVKLIINACCFLSRDFDFKKVWQFLPIPSQY